MKIDTDLRLAIKAAIKHHNKTKCDWNAWGDDQKKAVEKLASMPKYKSKIKKALADLQLASDIRDNAYKVFGILGIDSSMDRIRDEEKFEAAGGAVVKKNKELSEDTIMAELASATPKQAAEIIKKLGIKWE